MDEVRTSKGPTRPIYATFPVPAAPDYHGRLPSRPGIETVIRDLINWHESKGVVTR